MTDKELLTAWLLEHGDLYEHPNTSAPIHEFRYLQGNGYLIDQNLKEVWGAYHIALTDKGRELMESEDERVPD